MTPARRRQLAQIRQEAAGTPPAAPFAEPSPVAFRQLYRDGVLIATVGPDADLTDPPAEPVSERLIQGALENYEAHAATLEALCADLPPAEGLPAVPFIAPKKRRRRRKKSASDAPRKPGRPALGEAGPAARVSVSLAPETMAAVRLAARRRKVKLGTVLRELAEAWAAQTSRS